MPCVWLSHLSLLQLLCTSCRLCVHIRWSVSLPACSVKSRSVAILPCKKSLNWWVSVWFKVRQTARWGSLICLFGVESDTQPDVMRTPGSDTSGMTLHRAWKPSLQCHASVVCSGSCTTGWVEKHLWFCHLQCGSCVIHTHAYFKRQMMALMSTTVKTEGNKRL